jgi:hypothetical protein
MIDPVFAFAAFLALVGVAAGAWVGLRWLGRRATQHRMFDRFRPSKWPRTDYRVGRVYRPEDYK